MCAIQGEKGRETQTPLSTVAGAGTEEVLHAPPVPGRAHLLCCGKRQEMGDHITYDTSRVTCRAWADLEVAS